jgi:hypothetical protein
MAGRRASRKESGGTVRYPEGTPVWRAKVWTDSGSSALSDPTGHFVIDAPVKGHATPI